MDLSDNDRYHFDNYNNNNAIGRQVSTSGSSSPTIDSTDFQDQSVHIAPTRRSPTASSPRKNSVNYTKFFDLIAKYLILIITTDLSTLLLLMWIAIEATIPSLPQLNFVFLSIDSSINLLSTYLQYKFANEHYFKLCGKCHKSLKNRFEIKTMQDLDQSIKESIEL